MNGCWCVFVCLEIEAFVCELCLGVCVCCFGVCVIAVWGLHSFGFVAPAARPGKCAYHEFWIPGSPGAMILDRNWLLKI